MQEFEIVGEDGRTYLHYDNWQRWRNERLREYDYGNIRYDIELCHPRDHLRDTPIDHNPHPFGQDGWTCYYRSDNWSTIYGVYDAHRHDLGEESLRMLVEHDLEEPWGERIEIWCTSNRIEQEPWGHTPANRFALFRGRFWKVVNFEPLQEWRGGFPGERVYQDGRENWQQAINPPVGWNPPLWIGMGFNNGIVLPDIELPPIEVPPPPLYLIPRTSAGEAIKSWEVYQEIPEEDRGRATYF